MGPWVKDSEFSPFITDDTFSSFWTQDQQSERQWTIQAGLYIPKSLDCLSSLGMDSLDRLSHCVKRQYELATMLRLLKRVLQNIRDGGTTLSADAQFRTTHPLRLGWIPNHFGSLATGDPAYLIAIAHLFAVAVAISMTFSATDLEFFIFIRLKAVMQIHQALTHAPVYPCHSCEALHDATRMLEFPWEVVRTYCQYRKRD
jgi:hypothetical protein